MKKIQEIVKNATPGKASTTDIAAKVEKGWWETIRKLAQAHGISTKTVHATLHKDLKLSKESAKWVPKLVDEEIKKEQVRTSEVIVAIIAVAL